MKATEYPCEWASGYLLFVRQRHLLKAMSAIESMEFPQKEFVMHDLRITKNTLKYVAFGLSAEHSSKASRCQIDRALREAVDENL